MQWGDSNNTAPRKTGDKWRNCTRMETRAGQTSTGEQWRGGRKFTDGLVRGTWRTNNPTRRGEFADSSTNTEEYADSLINHHHAATSGKERRTTRKSTRAFAKKDSFMKFKRGTASKKLRDEEVWEGRWYGRHNKSTGAEEHGEKWMKPKYINERTAKTLSESTRRMYQNLAKERNHRTQSSREGSPSTLREKRIKYRPPIPEAYQDRSTT